MCLLLRVPAAESACGQGLRTGAHLRCFPSRRCAAGPSRSRSHGRLRRPKSLPIRHSPAAAQCFSPWAAGIIPVLTSALHRFSSLGLKSRIAARFAPDLTSLLHRFASLGLNSRIDARIAPVLTLWLHRFASLGLKSRIDARIAPVLTLWLHRFASLGLKSRIDAVLSCRRVEWPACGRSLPLRYRVRFKFSSPQSITVPPAESRCRYDAASDSNFCRRSEERPACSAVVGCRRGQDATKAA